MVTLKDYFLNLASFTKGKTFSNCCQIAEKIWSIGKREVACSNVSGNINFVLQKADESFRKIDAATWKRVIDHQFDEVIHLMEMDGLIAPIGIIVEDEEIIPQTFSIEIKVQAGLFNTIFGKLGKNDQTSWNSRNYDS